MKSIFFLSILTSFILTGCDKTCCIDSTETVVERGDTVNLIAPIANLEIPAADLTKETGSTLSLNGSDYSSDADGTIINYLWTFQNPAGEISSFKEERPTFVFSEAGIYEMCLTVTDNDNLKSNKSCKRITVSEISVTAPQYIIPEPVVTIYDENGNLLNNPVIMRKGITYTASGRESYDPDEIDQKKIINYQWVLTEYRKDEQGLFKKKHFCNVPGHTDHRTCPKSLNGQPIDYSQLKFRIHNSEIYRTIELTVTDSDIVNGKNQENTKTFAYKTDLYNNEDINTVTRDLTPLN